MSVSFDVAVRELFWPLVVGARVVLAPPAAHNDPAALVETAQQWTRLKKVISQSGSNQRGLALPAGSGIIYYPDDSLEPVRRPVTELIAKDEEVVHTLLFPPDAGGWLETGT